MEIPNFNPQIKPAGTSWKRWVATTVLGISLGLIVFYFREPLLAFAGKSWTSISTYFSGLGNVPFFGNLFTWMTNNPIPTLTAGFSLVASVITLAKYFSEAKAKTAAIQAQLQTQNKMQTYQNQFQDYITQKEGQIQELQGQINTQGSDILQSSLTEAQSLVTNQAEQIKSLNSQIEALNNIVLLKDTKIIEKIVVK